MANISILAIASTPGRWFVYVEIGRGTKRLETWLPRRLRFQRVSAGLVGVFWSTRSNWVDEMRLWKAVGDASYVLVLAALALVQLTKLIPSTRPWLPWHRQIGIWFAVTATLDGALIFNGWAPWSPRRFLGYEFVLQLGREARLEPGFGLATSSAPVWFMVGFARLPSHVDKRKRAQSSNLPVS